MNTSSIVESARSLIPVPAAGPAAPSRTPHRAAQALGLFSILLGAIEVAAPARLAAQLGLEGQENLVRGYGGREIAAGIAALGGFLAPAMWGRVAGDVLDLGTLAMGRRTDHRTARNISIALAAVGGIALVDLCVATMLSSRARH